VVLPVRHGKDGQEKRLELSSEKLKHKARDGITKENVPDPLLPTTTVSVIFCFESYYSLKGL